MGHRAGGYHCTTSDAVESRAGRLRGRPSHFSDRCALGERPSRAPLVDRSGFSRSKLAVTGAPGESSPDVLHESIGITNPWLVIFRRTSGENDVRIRDRCSSTAPSVRITTPPADECPPDVHVAEIAGLLVASSGRDLSISRASLRVAEAADRVLSVAQGRRGWRGCIGRGCGRLDRRSRRRRRFA